MLNDKPCDGCKHFDPVMRGNNKGLRSTAWAWCAKHSVYPKTEGPGQIFPVGAKRMTDADKPAQPKIVRKGEVVSNCMDFNPQKAVLSKEELLKKVRDKQSKGLLT